MNSNESMVHDVDCTSTILAAMLLLFALGSIAMELDQITAQFLGPNGQCLDAFSTTTTTTTISNGSVLKGAKNKPAPLFVQWLYSGSYNDLISGNDKKTSWQTNSNNL